MKRSKEMYRLTDRKYKDFLIGDVFNVYTGSLLPKNELRAGRIPRITASETNNGVIGTFSPSAHRNYRTLTNFISISFLGGVFYHPYTASLDMKIHAIQIADEDTPLNRYSGAFIVSAIKNAVSNYSYGDQLSSTDLPKKRVLLPINQQDVPDWDFMTLYMKQQEGLILAKYKNYLAVIERERES